MILTALFVSVILMFKGGAKTAPSKDGVLAVVCICLTLFTCIRTSGKLGGCFNPAVGMTLGSYQTAHLPNTNNTLSHYIYAFIIGPLLGGAVAGGFAHIHRKHFEDAVKGEKAE